MKRRGDRKRILGMVLAGCLLAGCFVPIIYGGYKYYESTNQVGIAVNINEPADEVYKTAIQVIGRNNIYKIVKQNDKDMILSVQTIANPEIEGTVTVTALSKKSSRFSAVKSKIKGMDPNLEKKELVGAVLSVCSEFKVVCTDVDKK